MANPVTTTQQTYTIQSTIQSIKDPVSTAAPSTNGTFFPIDVQPRIRDVELVVPANISEEPRGKWWSRKKPAAPSGYKDPWYTKSGRLTAFIGRFITDTARLAQEYPAGYPSLAAYMSDDIDGRIYRRFSYLRNRLLLHTQDKLNALEQALEDVDRDDEEKAKKGEKEALYRLISRRYNEQTADLKDGDKAQQCSCCCAENGNRNTASNPNPPPVEPQNNATRRLKIMQDVEETLQKYDELLLREHEISSIRESTSKQRRSLGNFIWNGKECGPGNPKKPLSTQENKLIYRKDDSILLGTQEDAWLGTAAESLKRLMPAVLRKVSPTNPEDKIQVTHPVVAPSCDSRGSRKE